MKKWCRLLMLFGALQLLAGLALVPVGWWAIVSDHYVAWDRLGVAFRDGAIDAETYPQFASANGIYYSAGAHGASDSEQLLIWVNAGSQKVPPLVIVCPWLLVGCGLVSLLFAWRLGRAAARAGTAS
jgi:hypothetical protein